MEGQLSIFKIVGTGSISISVQALKGQLINWGYLYPLTPAQAPAIAANRPSVGTVEWQVPANKQAAYMLVLQMPRRRGTPLLEHRLRRSVFQKTTNRGQEAVFAANDPKQSHPQYSAPADLAVYSEFIKFN